MIAGEVSERAFITTLIPRAAKVKTYKEGLPNHMTWANTWDTWDVLGHITTRDYPKKESLGCRSRHVLACAIVTTITTMENYLIQESLISI